MAIQERVRPASEQGTAKVAPTAKRTGRGRLGPLLRKGVFFVHLWLGLILGLYMVLVGTTGSMLLFQAEIDRTLNPRLHHVQPVGECVPVETALASAQRAFPNAKFDEVVLDDNPTAPYEFQTGEVKYEDWTLTRRGRRQVYVNPYTAEVLGSRPRYGEVFNFLFYLHRDLLLGINGAMWNRYAAIPWGITLLSGLWLWWPALRNFGAQLRMRLTVQRGASYKRLIHDLHNVTGIYPLVILLLPVITGAIWGFWTPVEQLAYRLTGTPHGIEKPEPPKPREGATSTITLDQALEVARLHYPEAKIVSVRLSRKKEAIEVTKEFSVQEHLPKANVTLHLDPADGRLLHATDDRTRSRGETAMAWVYPLHVGEWGERFGPAADVFVRLLYLLAGLAPLALFVTGLLKYLEKRRAKAANRRRHQEKVAQGKATVPTSR